MEHIEVKIVINEKSLKTDIQILYYEVSLLLFEAKSGSLLIHKRGNVLVLESKGIDQRNKLIAIASSTFY